jgi:hypothetical protein
VHESGSFNVVATVVLTVVSVFLGSKYRKWLERSRFFAKLFGYTIAAAEDDKITEEEFQEIVTKAKKAAAKVKGKPLKWNALLSAVFVGGLLLGAVEHSAVNNLVQIQNVRTTRSVGVEVYADEALSQILDEITYSPED